MMILQLKGRQLVGEEKQWQNNQNQSTQISKPSNRKVETVFIFLFLFSTVFPTS